MRDNYEVFDTEMEAERKKNLDVLLKTVEELRSLDMTKRKNKRLGELRKLYINVSIKKLIQKRINDLIIKKLKRGIRNAIRRKK